MSNVIILVGRGAPAKGFKEIGLPLDDGSRLIVRLAPEVFAELGQLILMQIYQEQRIVREAAARRN